MSGTEKVHMIKNENVDIDRGHLREISELIQIKMRASEIFIRETVNNIEEMKVKTRVKTIRLKKENSTMMIFTEGTCAVPIIMAVRRILVLAKRFGKGAITLLNLEGA